MNIYVALELVGLSDENVESPAWMCNKIAAAAFVGRRVLGTEGGLLWIFDWAGITAGSDHQMSLSDAS